jgi:hypothetical protein
MFLSVGGSGSYGNIWFSPSAVTINQGQSSSVTIYGNQYSNNYYVSNNDNSTVVTTSISGNSLTLYGSSYGTARITVCGYNTSGCGILTVTVLSSGSGGNQLILSNNSLTLSTGQTQNVLVYGGLSSIYNISCYLKCFNICHNAISANNCFVSPKYHSVMLLGGWWYSCRKDDNIVALPKVSFKTCPPDILNTKIADHRLDLLLIRQLGIYCLGDDTGMDLLTRKDVPKSLTVFLRSSSSGDALKDYSYWQKEVLPNSFGKRRFVEMDVKGSDIFQEI